MVYLRLNQSIVPNTAKVCVFVKIPESSTPMIPTIVGSLIYIKGRGLMELFSPRLRNLWTDWELRVLVLLSLILQVVLIFFGNRRKYTSRTWIRIVLWCAYLMADWVATVALGVISNNLGEAMKSTGKDGSLNDGIQLTAFWAPFLLLHLGGPDTITAYSLEDNELWLRHLLGLSVQTGVAFYIFLIAWTGSQLSILSILMFFPGIIKYGERTWVLRSASNEQFRESMLTSPDPGPNYSKFMREYTVKQSEGFYVRADEVIEVQVEKPPSENETVDDAAELVIANDLFKSFKRLFVDLILGFDDRDNSQSLFGKFSWEEAFKVIEMELGFAYDVLYTKATVIYSTKGEGIDQTIPTGDNRPKPDWEILKLSVQVEFDQSILIWHIATDLCYHSDCTDQDTSMSNRELSKWLSQYMLYILVRRPFMLPMGVGMIRFRDTCAEVTQFFEERKSIASPSDAVTLDKSQACEILLKVNTEVAPNKVKGDRSKSVLFDACKLASELQAISDENQKWEMISNVWVEMLAYAACHCRGNYHAQQLRRGGELLTHVWLLMAHFGLTEQFQISQGHARAKLVVE
nr:hypothetical protein CFP56_67520 [Quercus suber]